MATITSQRATDWTAADLVELFGPMPLQRIRFEPPPGTATEQDVFDIHNRENRLFELVEGVLVEKTMGIQESYLAVLIARLIGNFVETADLGIVLGADGMARLAPGLVRIPDVSFVPWSRLPGKSVPNQPVLTLAPALAVEVLSPSNTAKEMERKLRDYFEAGVELVWFVDPRTRTAQVFLGPDRSTELNADGSLDGGNVVPGFSLPLRELFAKLSSDDRVSG